jgi:uncharacterized protein YrrD
MRISEAIGRKVVSLATAETIGTVDEFLVDPHGRRIVGLELAGVKQGNTLPWAHIESFGPDAVTVRDAERVGEADADLTRFAGKSHRFLGKRVLSTSGDELGQLDEVEFDADSGALLSLRWADRQNDSGRLVGIGSYAVVVRAD